MGAIARSCGKQPRSAAVAAIAAAAACLPVGSVARLVGRQAGLQVSSTWLLSTAMIASGCVSIPAAAWPAAGLGAKLWPLDSVLVQLSFIG